MSGTSVKVLSKVVGVGACANDVIACYGETITQHVVLFPGDVQDYYAAMSTHRDNHVWKEYSLEDTARIMFHQFDHACVWVIRASKLHLNTFACYKNFVQSNMFGVPNYSLTSVRALLQTAELVNNCVQQEFSEDVCEDIASKPVSIVGFSKGCCVLNQMIYEWPLLAPTSNNMLRQFTQRISKLFWLDSGNCGHSGAWVTDEACIRVVAKDVEFNVCVTPYQVSDKFRPWIGEELDEFISYLKEHNAKLKEDLHFQDDEPSLKNHFKLLREFHRKIEVS